MPTPKVIQPIANFFASTFFPSPRALLTRAVAEIIIPIPTAIVKNCTFHAKPRAATNLSSPSLEIQNKLAKSTTNMKVKPSIPVTVILITWDIIDPCKNLAL